MSNQGRCWHCGQPRKEIHETLTCGSEECVAFALKSREKARQRIAKAKSRWQSPKAKDWQRLSKPKAKVKSKALGLALMESTSNHGLPEVFPEAFPEASIIHYAQVNRRRKRQREYRQRPEVKARRREYERARYQRKKAQEEE